MKLYVIGNGFDLSHGVKSSYRDFKDYLLMNDSELIDKLDEFIDTESLWSDFEEALVEMDGDAISDYASSSLISYASDEWSDAYHHEYQFYIEEGVELITKRLKEHFTNWILGLKIHSNKRVKFCLNSKFLTFNYTSVLELIYKIKRKDILYIHNKAVNTNSTLILGHSRNKANRISFQEKTDEDTDPRVAEGNRLLDDYYEETYKDTETIIKNNSIYFNDLKNINKIYVYGHSISKVDEEYFIELIKYVDKKAFWTVSYYDDLERIKLKDKLIKLGVVANNINLIRI